MGRTVQRVLEATLEAARLLTVCTHTTLPAADARDGLGRVPTIISSDGFRGRPDSQGAELP